MDVELQFYRRVICERTQFAAINTGSTIAVSVTRLN